MGLRSFEPEAALGTDGLAGRAIGEARVGMDAGDGRVGPDAVAIWPGGFDPAVVVRSAADGGEGFVEDPVRFGLGVEALGTFQEDAYLGPDGGDWLRGGIF